MAKMAPLISRAEAIQTAHANIDALLSSEATKNAFPAEVIEKAKGFFEQVYEERFNISRKLGPRRKPDLLVAAVIHAACRQCKGQSRTFNETALLIGTEKVATLEKCYILIDQLLWSMNSSEVKEVQSETAPLTPYIHGARTSAADLAARWSAMLHLSSKGIRLASELASRMEEWTSRSPANTAGAAIYAVGRLLGMELTLVSISDASQATIGSLVNAYKEVYLRKEVYCPMEWLVENELNMERLPMI